MPLKPLEIKKILVISLTNIGDVVLTFPVIDILRHDFPQSYLKIVAGPKAESLLKNNPHFQAVQIFNKHQRLGKMIPWVMDLKREHYDLVVDLRHTAIPLFIFPKHKTSFFTPHADNLHMKEKHLAHLKTVYSFARLSFKQYCLFISKDDEQYVRSKFESFLTNGERYVVVAPGAANRDKRYSEEGFAEICDVLVKKYGLKIVFAGDWEDKKISCRILEMMSSPALNLCGETTLPQLGCVLKRATFALVNDSAPMHIASYLNVPVISLFGPSNPNRYGPWSTQNIVLHNNAGCLKCVNPKAEDLHQCMQAISTDEVMRAINNLLALSGNK